MKNFVLTLLLLVFTGEVITLFVMKNSELREKVLAVSVTPTPLLTPSPTPLPSPTPTPTPAPTPKKTPKPTPTPVPQPKVTSQEINGFIERFSGQYGVDPNVIRHIAICESGFNPNAKNGQYIGLFQFGATTWKNLRAEFGEDPNPDLRTNAEEATQTAAYAFSKGKRGIWPNCAP